MIIFYEYDPADPVILLSVFNVFADFVNSLSSGGAKDHSPGWSEGACLHSLFNRPWSVTLASAGRIAGFIRFFSSFRQV